MLNNQKVHREARLSHENDSFQKLSINVRNNSTSDLAVLLFPQESAIKLSKFHKCLFSNLKGILSDVI